MPRGTDTLWLDAELLSLNIMRTKNVSIVDPDLYADFANVA